MFIASLLVSLVAAFGIQSVALVNRTTLASEGIEGTAMTLELELHELVLGGGGHWRNLIPPHPSHHRPPLKLGLRSLDSLLNFGRVKEWAIPKCKNMLESY